ncbi:MAG: polysaccharide deacetylase family protein [Christensenellales bacterium]|jgi:polysaccharide deacetylase
MRFLLIKKKRILTGALVLVMLVAGLLAVGFTGAYGVYAEKTTRKLPIYCVESAEPKVAISFDASWGADKTLSILEILERYDIKANFFTVGFWAEKYPDILKKLSDSGRMEIGTHSNTHPHMPKLSRSQMKLELETSSKIIESVTGKKPDLFRAPFGDYNDALIETAEEMGLYTIQWDVDSLDWKGLKSGEMAARVINKTQNGSIILMHNDGEHTVEALPLIIEGLKNKGFTFVTIGELIYRDNFTIDHTGKQIRIEG